MIQKRLDIVNPRRYKSLWTQVGFSLLLFSSVAVFYIISGNSLAGVLTLVTLLLSVGRVTQEVLVTQVELTADEIIVYYYQRFRCHKTTLLIADTSISDPCEPTYILELLGIHRLYLEGASQTFCLSTSDGFLPQQLQTLHDELVGDDSNS